MNPATVPTAISIAVIHDSTSDLGAAGLFPDAGFGLRLALAGVEGVAGFGPIVGAGLADPDLVCSSIRSTLTVPSKYASRPLLSRTSTHRSPSPRRPG